ncbi:S41 family peptidase [Pseudoclavibacter helvolus]|uniref:S41 family peptidase n=1 Tax=Pseudoclavibacter helvolus TaxID=255205 RepID=UPI003C743BAE
MTSWRLRSARLFAAGAALLLVSACAVQDAPRPLPTSTATAVTPEELTIEAADILEEHGLYSGGDWSAQRSELLEAGRTAADLEEAREAIAVAASSAGGVHTWYMSPSDREQRYSDAPGLPPTVESTRGNTVTITVPAIGQEGEAARTYAEVGSRGLTGRATSETCGFIVDLRGNHGGNMYPMLGAVSPLLDQVEVASLVDRDGNVSAIAVTSSKVSAGDHPPLTYATPVVQFDLSGAGLPIAVLQDMETGSAAEMVLTAFRGQENVRTFGMQSAGRATGNDAWVLRDGSELVLTTTNYADRTGAIMPLPIPADVSTISDDAEEAAHDWISETCVE